MKLLFALVCFLGQRSRDKGLKNRLERGICRRKKSHIIIVAAAVVAAVVAVAVALSLVIADSCRRVAIAFSPKGRRFNKIVWRWRAVSDSSRNKARGANRRRMEPLYRGWIYALTICIGSDQRSK